MGFRRGIVAVAVATGAMLLCACTAKTSHPTQLSGSPAEDTAPATSAAPGSPVASAPTPSVAPSVAVSSSAASKPTTSAGTSTSPAPSLPSALSSNDIAAGVRATAQEFFDDFNQAFATGDVTKIEALTSPACGCRSIVNTIKATYAKHQRFVDEVLTLRSISVVSFVPSGASADIHYSISACRVLDASGAQVDTADPFPNGHSALFVINVNGKWLVQQNTLLDEGQ